MRPIWVAWSVVAFPIGWVVSTVFLAVLFYGVFTPIGARVPTRRAATCWRFVAPMRGRYWKPRPAARNKRAVFQTELAVRSRRN